MDTKNTSPQLLDAIVGTLLFPRVFRTFRMAIQPSKLLIAFLALAIICLAGWIMDFNRTVTTDPQGAATELDAYMDRLSVSQFRQLHEENGGRQGVFSTLWHFNRQRFNDALYSLFAFNISDVAKNIAQCSKAAAWAIRYHTIYSAIFALIKLTVIAIAGGAICRIAALQFGCGEKPGVVEALRFSITRFFSFFLAPLVLMVPIVILGLCVLALGALGNLGWGVGNLLMGIFILAALLAGALITVFLIGIAAGFNLMFPTIAYEGSDWLDGASRSFHYVYSKPWRMGFYMALAAVYGAICYVFARFFAFLLLFVTHVLLDIGLFWTPGKLARIWPKPTFLSLLAPGPDASMPWSEDFAAVLIYLCSLAVIGLLIAFIMSFYFSATTIIYALMRNRVDNTALEEIYQHSEEIETAPATATQVETDPQPEQPQTDLQAQQPEPQPEQPRPESETEDP
ncbi:MAG: hypothetical protein ACYTBJ_07280 [Planctomycetota bacterium]|jgi:hypothetical protein